MPSRVLLVLLLVPFASDLSATAVGWDESVMTWPVSVVLTHDKAVISNNKLFTEGDTLIFFYDEPESCLYMNGEVWRTWKPHRSKPHKPGWGDLLRARFDEDTVGTDAERIRRAFESMDQSVLDSTFTPVLNSREVTVRFSGSREVGTIVIVPFQYNPKEQAEIAVRGLATEMRQPGANVEVNYPGRQYSKSGRSAERLLTALRDAKEGRASRDDFDTARDESVLEAVQAIYAEATGIPLEEVREMDDEWVNAWVQEEAPGTSRTILRREREPGRGPVVRRGMRVRFSYTGYAEKRQIRGRDKTGMRVFICGSGELGPGLDQALSGMQVGGIDDVVVSEEIAGTMRENWPQMKPGSSLHLRIEVLEATSP